VKECNLGLINPLEAIIISFCFLGILLYRRVNLGITLNATALLLGFLTLNWIEIPTVIVNTTVNAYTIIITLTTFLIMLLSQLYKGTKVINVLSESLSKLIKNSKIVSSVLPAIIGFLPVAGGALMSAPLVDVEAGKLNLKPERKAYINLWFRHTIFPVYPVSQLLILTVALTGITMQALILRQIPVVLVMITVGYIIGFWKVSPQKKKVKKESEKTNFGIKSFIWSFSPILATIIVVVCLDLAGLISIKGLDVLSASLIGLIVLVLISKLTMQTFLKPLKNYEIYGVTFAVYGAFLLKNVVDASNLSQTFQALVANGSINTTMLLTLIPAALGFIMGSPSGSIAISVPILSGILDFSPKTAALLYMSAYLGYLIAPTHLCFTFTAEYFKCSMGKMYKYVIPSFIISFTTALLIYFLF